jgi:hypothetical protein
MEHVVNIIMPLLRMASRRYFSEYWDIARPNATIKVVLEATAL